MTVLLTILKVIGWILLGILGLILLTVLTVLLVPIRYRADGVWKEEKYIRGRVTWLLHLLSIRVTYEKELLLEVRVAGFLIYPKKERLGKEKKAAEEGEAEEGTTAAGAELPDEIENAKVPDLAADKVTGAKPQSADQNGESADRSEEEASATKDTAPGQTAGSFFEKLSGKLSQVTDRLRGMQHKTDQFKHKLVYYKKIWDQPQTRQAIRVGFYELCRILKHVQPQKLEIVGSVGTGDPASTGQIMAIQGMLYPWHKGNIRLEPDFEEKYIEGELHLKGRIRLGTLGICGLRILLNKNVRRLIRILRKKEEA